MLKREVFCCEGDSLYRFWCGHCDAVSRRGGEFPAFGRLIDRQIDGGTDAIIVCGTTGEAATMTQKERMETIAYCVDRVAGRVPVIAVPAPTILR